MSMVEIKFSAGLRELSAPFNRFSAIALAQQRMKRKPKAMEQK